MKITRISLEGAPNGVYQINWYELQNDGSFVLMPEIDECRLKYAESVTVKKNQIAICNCASQAGGMIHAGSVATMKAWDKAKSV